MAFENAKGELDEFDSKKLGSIIGSKKNMTTKLVFVNACHSLEVAKVFIEAGIPYVVAV